MPLDCEPTRKLCPKCQVGAMEKCYGYTPEPHHQLGSFDLCTACDWFDRFEPETEDLPKSADDR